MSTRPLAWRLVAVLLFVAAVALGWLAFTGFDGPGEPTDSPEAQRAVEREQVRAAQRSMALGLGASFALLGTFACWQRGGQAHDAEGNAGRPPQP